MIAYLSGQIVQKDIDSAVIDVRGVGYGVYVDNEDLAKLENGQTAKLYVYEHIREQAHELFAFLDQNDKKLFEKLLAVNGVGPRMALSMLNIGSADKLKQAIADGDVRFIAQASGVGKRVAERIVIDLKDKVGLLSSESATDFLKGVDVNDEAVQALLGLGFNNTEAAQALSGIDKNLTPEEKIKQALKGKNNER